MPRLLIIDDDVPPPMVSAGRAVVAELVAQKKK